MRSLRRFAPVAVLLLAPVLAGCGDDGGDDTDANEGAPPSSSSPDAPDSSDPTDDPDGSSAPTTEATGQLGACDVLTSEDVAAAYGVDFGPAEPGGGGHSENDVEWQSDNCSWEAEDLVEVQLNVSRPEDFEAGFSCPEPTAIAATVTPLPAPAPQVDSAWWKEDDAPPLEAVLRLCTADYLVDIEVEYEDGTDFQGDPQAQTLGLSTVALEKLG